MAFSQIRLGGGLAEKTFLITFWCITRLISNRLLHSTELLSLVPDLRVIYLALFTVHCDCMLWANQQGKQCVLTGFIKHQNTYIMPTLLLVEGYC